jgi:adenylate cyclase class IV
MQTIISIVLKKKNMIYEHDHRKLMQDKELAKIRDSRGYNYADIITCSEAGQKL